MPSRSSPSPNAIEKCNILPGITSILAFGGRYARISDEIITGLKQCTNENELVELRAEFVPEKP
jgi:hypothetical protein